MLQAPMPSAASFFPSANGRFRNNDGCGYEKEEPVSPTHPRPIILLAVSLLFAATGLPGASFRGPELSAQQQKELRDNFALCVSKLKGPYTENFCVCPDGRKVPVRSASGQIGIGCKNALFCAAYRAPWAEALAKQGVYIGNIFSRD